MPSVPEGEWAGAFGNKEKEMSWMSNQVQEILNQLDPFPWKLRNPRAFDGHGLGIHHGAVPLPGMVPQVPGARKSF